MSFNVGDTVRLKSGGPDMTVMRVGTAGGESMVWCAWFEGTKDAYGLFPPETLKALEPQPTGVGSTPVAPDAVEASQDAHPTPADSAPLAEKSEKSLEAQIASVQSLIANLLKRS